MKINDLRNGVRPYFSGKSRLTLFLRGMIGGVVAMSIGACGTSDPKRAPAFDPQFARAVTDTATQAAVARPGAKVCRQMQVGIAERDWVRGVVMEVSAETIGVRVEDPGRFPHTLNGTAVVRGALVRDASRAWTPCLF